MEIDRARYLDARQWSNATLAKAANLTEEVVRDWVAGQSSDPHVHGSVCRALAVEPGFFDRPERLRALLTERWEALESGCPCFRELLESRSNADGTDVIEQICADLQGGGGRLLYPTLASPDFTVRTHEELDAVESFLNFALLMTVDAKHQYDINVDGPDPMVISSSDTSSDTLSRLLVDYLHAPDTRVSRLPVDNGELQRSPHSLFFEELAAAEVSEEDGCNAFLAELANTVGLKRWLLQTGPEDSESDNRTMDILSDERLLDEMRGEIRLRRRSAKHVIGIAGSNTPESHSGRIKTIYRDELRVARLDARSEGGVVHCGESALRALVRGMFREVRDRRHQLEGRHPESYSRSESMNGDKGGDTYHIHGPVGQVGRDHTMERMDARQHHPVVVELSGPQIRELLRQMSTELRGADQEKLAKEAETLAADEAGGGVQEEAAGFLDKGFKALERADKALEFYQRLPEPFRAALSKLPEFPFS